MNVRKLKQSAMAAIGLCALCLPRAGLAQDPNLGVLPPESPQYGASYGEWVARWWQWMGPFPAETSPGFDQTGEDAARGQSGRVWFLADCHPFLLGPGETLTRTCSIPEGKALFFPVCMLPCITIPGVDFPIEDPPIDPVEWFSENEDAIREQVASNMEGVSEMFCEIDGASVPDLERYYVESPMFAMHADEAVGVPTGDYAACIGDGIYLMLAPLSVGPHTIHFRVVQWLPWFSPETPEGHTRYVDVTYSLTVTPVASFTRITTGPIVTDGGYSQMGTWVDYDNDGDMDLFVANGDSASHGFGGPPQPNCLYRNDGNGTFTKLTDGPVVTEVASSNGGVWGDYDNDGHLDLFVINNGEGSSSLYRNAFYRNGGDSTFTKITDSPVVQDGGIHWSGAWADYDNDGHLDLLVADFNSPRLLYHNNGDTTFTRITQGSLATDVTASCSAAWADYDNDGAPDLFVANAGPGATARRNSLYRNEGEGTFTRITTGHPVAESAINNAAEWGDYDSDGDLDLFVCVTITGNNFLFQNNGDGTFRKITSGAMVATGGNVSAWGDYDNDGFLDLFLVGGITRVWPDYLYHNNGDGTFTQMTTGAPGADGGRNSGCAWGDYDNDGFLDLFLANFYDEDNFLYHNDGNAHHWLKVKLVGTVSNRAAIGAKVRVRAPLSGTAYWQLREIGGGSGYAGQNLLAHFGLRDAEKAEVVRIEWPSGIVQELRDVPANQTLTVTEPARLQITGPGQFRIQSWEGQAFEVQSSIDLKNWQAVTTITNLTGTLEFSDTNAVQQTACFYRAVQR